VLSSRLYSGTLQDVPQTRTGESGSAHGALAPLNTGNLRTMQTATVARALQRVDNGMSLQLREFREGEGERPIDETVNEKSIVVRVDSGNTGVMSLVMQVGRRNDALQILQRSKIFTGNDSGRRARQLHGRRPSPHRRCPVPRHMSRVRS